MSWLDRWLCGITSHQDAMRTSDKGRLYLACQCGWSSTGIQIVAKVEPTRRIIPMQLVQAAERARRVA